MHFRLSLLATALLAGSATAFPAKSSNIARRLARRAGTHLSNPMIPAPLVEGEEKSVAGGNVTETDYSSNWSGAVYTAAPAGATYTAVSASFTVPTPKATSGSTSGSGSAWVGIDGDTCGSAILQTGIDFTVRNGQTSYDAWYEWYPDYAYDFSGFSMKAGDVIVATATSSSKSKGVVTLQNLSNGQKVSKTLSAPSSSGTLCGQNIEWIVEDYEQGSSLVPLANWGTVNFSGSKGSTNKGNTVDASGANTIDIRQNGKVLTDVSISGSTVSVKYTGS